MIEKSYRLLIEELRNPNFSKICKSKTKIKQYNDIIKLARTEDKTEEQKTTLYDNIDKIAISASRGNGNARFLLCYIYFPVFIKIASTIISKIGYLSSRLTGLDIINEAVIIFYDCVDKYDSKITTFSTYLSRIIIVKIYAKIYRYVNNTLRREVPYPLTVHSGVVDLAFHTKTNLHNTVIENILLKDLKELVDKVKKRKEKTGRGRKTTNSICDNYFFGDKTCSEVAKDLGISYHAVNEQINNISAEIADMLNHNEYCGYYITPSSKINKRYKITKKDSKYDSAHISKFRKKICSNCNKENILDRKSVLSNVMVCRYCNMPTAV